MGVDISNCVVALYEAANMLLDEAGGPSRPPLQLAVQVLHALLEVLKATGCVLLQKEPTGTEVL